MPTLSITAFLATLFPPLLLSPTLESRETLLLHTAETELTPISPASPDQAVAAAAIAKPDAPIASAISPEAPTTRVVPAKIVSAKSYIDENLHCLALNIYHEARSEPLSGQLAVAKVTLNRVASKSFPQSVCEVVKQGGQKRNRCQFSWWCDGKSDQPTETKAWQNSLDLGRRVLANQVSDPTNGALYYHATYVAPKWSRSFQRTAQIGRHLFYRPASTASQS